MRGNVVDMAVGVVIGAAFGKIVTSFTSDLLMPPIGMLTGGMDAEDGKKSSPEEARPTALGAPVPAVATPGLPPLPQLAAYCATLNSKMRSDMLALIRLASCKSAKAGH